MTYLIFSLKRKQWIQGARITLLPRLYMCRVFVHFIFLSYMFYVMCSAHLYGSLFEPPIVASVYVLADLTFGSPWMPLLFNLQTICIGSSYHLKIALFGFENKITGCRCCNVAIHASMGYVRKGRVWRKEAHECTCLQVAFDSLSSFWLFGSKHSITFSLEFRLNFIQLW